MAVTRSLERSAAIEIQRRQLKVMPEDQLRGLADSLMVAFHDRDQLLRNAMRRIAELEVKQALMDCGAAARQRRSEQRQLGPVARLIRRLLWWRQ